VTHYPNPRDYRKVCLTLYQGGIVKNKDLGIISQAASCKLQAASCKRQAASGKLQATSDKRQATSDKLQATSCKRQAASTKALV